MKIFAFAASARKDSFNKKLIHFTGELLKKTPGIELDLVDFKSFTMPTYDGDLEDASGIPAAGLEFIKHIEAADAIVISTPEYNGGIPGALKNAIDWASRAEKNPIAGKPLLLIGASPGALGAVRSLWHTRVPLEVLGALVYPTMFGLSKADQAFDANGNFIEVRNQTQVESLVKKFIAYATALKH